MFTNPEQFANATKALFEFQLETFNTLTSKTVQGVEQVIALNMSTAKSHLEDGLAAGKEISQASDAKAAMQVAADKIQPGVASVDFAASAPNAHVNMIAAADDLLYAAKNSGRNRVCAQQLV